MRTVNPHDREAIAMSDQTNAPLEGWVPELADDNELFDALEKAFDYRGDVTVTTHDGTVVSGYLFDRRKGSGLADSSIRIMPADGSATATITYDQVVRLKFADKDPAAGRSWENWVKRYVEKKKRGESTDLYAEPLDE